MAAYLPHVLAPISNTAAFDGKGRIWFTGQTGIYGRLDPTTGEMDVWDAPKGVCSCLPHHRNAFRRLSFGLACRRLSRQAGHGDRRTTVIEPKTENAGTRRVWSDSEGRLWISEWNAGNLSLYDPASKSWTVYKLPGNDPRAYAVYVDDKDKVWVTDFSANAILSFDPESKSFQDFPSDKPDAAVRQLNGRAGEVWDAESGADRLVVIRATDR